MGSAQHSRLRIKTDAPNTLQYVPLDWIEPNPENVRLFVERIPLRGLENVYRGTSDAVAIFPDAPVVRYMGRRANGTPRLVLLAGERRVTAARNVNLPGMNVRVVCLTDEDAYKFVLRHNDVAGLTTLELAFRAAEMDRMGFSHDEIARELGGVATHRYLAVGELVDPELFTDEEKLCDPSIVEWFEAAKFGKEHFAWCFDNWNKGRWNDNQCSHNFRRRGQVLPLDNAEKGFRVTFDADRLVIRGQCDLNLIAQDVAYDMLYLLAQHIDVALEKMSNGDDFGSREVVLINPTTVT